MSEVKEIKSTETFGKVRVEFLEYHDERGPLECFVNFVGGDCIHGSQKEEFIDDLRDLLNYYGGV